MKERKNILLVVIDCLRFDHVTPRYMPLLCKWGDQNIRFTNCWSASHCTDPSVTYLLSGKHPDELGLYSMWQEHRDVTMPEDLEMLPQVAQRQGYETVLISNLGRWYLRGIKLHSDTSSLSPGVGPYLIAKDWMRPLPEPWFIILHDVNLHSPYLRGNYDEAAEMVDVMLTSLLEKIGPETYVFITADHGEGLGDRNITQHGYGLFDFLTHVPLLCSRDEGAVISNPDWLVDHGSLHWALLKCIKGEYPSFIVRDLVFQAGDTPPDMRHRGVVLPDRRQYIHENKAGATREYWMGDFGDAERIYTLRALTDHCARCGIDWPGEEMDREVLMRLKGLGYFG